MGINTVGSSHAENTFLALKMTSVSGNPKTLTEAVQCTHRYVRILSPDKPIQFLGTCTTVNDSMMMV